MCSRQLLFFYHCLTFLLGLLVCFLSAEFGGQHTYCSRSFLKILSVNSAASKKLVNNGMASLLGDLSVCQSHTKYFSMHSNVLGHKKNKFPQFVKCSSYNCNKISRCPDSWNAEKMGLSQHIIYLNASFRHTSPCSTAHSLSAT